MSKIELTDQQILAHVDHTLLKPFATEADIDQLCKEAIEYKVASVCVPPTYVWHIHKKFGKELPICTVVGFPLGYSVTLAKAEEIRKAIDEGAAEIDMVINITDAKNGHFNKITGEIADLKRICGTNILKVIIETCYLTEAEKIQLCKCVTEAGADFINAGCARLGTSSAIKILSNQESSGY